MRTKCLLLYWKLTADVIKNMQKKNVKKEKYLKSV